MAAPFRVFLVTADPAEARRIREALRQAEVPVVVAVAPDGGTAIALLRRRPHPTTAAAAETETVTVTVTVTQIETATDGGSAPLPDPVPDLVPDLVLVDEALAGISALDVLNAMRNHPVLRMVPAFVLTSGSEDAGPEQSRRAVDAGATGFLVKPLSETSVRHLVGFVDRLTRRTPTPRAN